MTSTENALNWFEISVADIRRAKKFYETIFGIEMQEQEMMGRKMAYFPSEDMNGKVSGCIIQSDMNKPSADGAKIYLNGNPDLANARITVDLDAQTVTASDGRSFSFEVDPFRKHCLMNGLDDIGLSLEKVASIDAYEKQTSSLRPWV